MTAVHVCCNDWKNGAFTGKVSSIEIGSTTLECRFSNWEPRITEGADFIRIGGKKLRCSGATYSVGNWCWNAYRCHDADVLALINWPKFRKWFQMTEAPERVADAYNNGKPLRLVSPKREAVAQ